MGLRIYGVSAGGSSYTDEEAQDAVGSILVDSTEIDFTYDDATPSITASLKNGSIVYGRVQDVTASRILGNPTGAPASMSEVSLGVGLGFLGTSIVSTITQYTDELAQDAIGGILLDSASINFTYDDGVPSITAVVIDNTTVQKIAARKNSAGGDVGTRRRLNFIEGANISITLADDGVSDELDVTITGSAGYTDEQAQDAVGTILADTATINFTYNDGAPSIIADVIDNTSIQKVTVRKNTGADVGSRKRLNFIEGTNVTLTVADDGGGDEIDITIAAAGGGSEAAANKVLRYQQFG
jgi:hypothetical protein